MSAVGDAVERVDHKVGDGLERLVRKHHRRRLERLGRAEALKPPRDSGLWAEGAPPPRRGNAFEVLIDGDSALPAIAAALRAARSHVHIAGWHLTPEFPLVRGEEELRLRDVLAELAERIDV